MQHRLRHSGGLANRIGANNPFNWDAYWASLISATVEDDARDEVVLTFPSAKESLTTYDFTIVGNTVINISWVGPVCTLTTLFDFVWGEDTTVSLKGLTGQSITNNITHIPYPAVGNIIEISHEVTFASNEFDLPDGVTTFFFIDNGLNMTAYYNGIVWEFFYVVYGKLYNWYAIDPARVGGDSFTSSDDWNVPTDANWTTLTDYCIASSPAIDAGNVGNHLKSRRQDNSPLGAPWDTDDDPYWFNNVTHWGLDTFRLGIVPGGFRRGSDGTWSAPGGRTDRWTATSAGANATERYLRYAAGTVAALSGPYKKYGYSINLVRIATVAEQALADGTVVDIYYQNNGYPLKCVKIGTQVWTSEVFETKWRDGTDIPFEGVNPGYFTDVEWAALVTPGVCSYNNNDVYNYLPLYQPLFQKYNSNPIITKGEAGSWESTGIRDPILLVDTNGNLVKEGGKYIMYYNGRGAGLTKVGRATSTDKINWIKEATNPVFEDADYAGAGSIIKRGDGDYIMYYAYEGCTKFNYATSDDGINWVRNDVDDPIMEIADIDDTITMGLPNVVEIDGTQYMVFELYIDDWQIYMAKSVNWIDWEYVGKIYQPVYEYFDWRTQANPSLYKVDDNYFIIIYNGQSIPDNFHLGILHSNSIENGWKRLQNAPILHNGIDGVWDDTRIEGGRVYRDKINQPGFNLFYFGLPTTNSFLDGAIGITRCLPDVTFEYQVV